MSEGASVPGPLDGLKVLDFTTMMSGPMSTKLLVDMGADVVKVESPAGDQNRTRTPVFGGVSRYFAQLNAGKRSVVLDLKSAEDLSTALALAERADVLIENNRPGVMDRLGLGYAAVSRRNPGIVYCSISGFGQDGPDAQRAAYAPIVHAGSGYDLAMMGYQDHPSLPANNAIHLADALTALYATAAVEGALLARQRTGRGEYIDVALQDSMFNLMVFEMQAAQLAQPVVRSVFKPMPASDGFVQIAIINQKQFTTLMETIGRHDVLADERFATIAARELVWDELMAIVAAWTRVRTATECVEVLAAAGLPVTVYRTPSEALNDPAVHRRGVLASRRDAGGEYALINPPFQFSDRSVHNRGEAPALGGDIDSVRDDWLGA
jgi:CoA:oxalate CoA-transferase